MEKKYLAGKLDKNIVFGLSWLIPIFGIIEFIIDKDVLDLEEKRDLVSMFVTVVAIIVLTIIPVIGWLCELVVAVLWIIKIIMSFVGKEFKIPGAYHIASAIIK